ncbi:hypothetical protein TNIN_365441, partial [Trichonephila inaurata madagascariensis]
KAPWRKVGR